MAKKAKAETVAMEIWHSPAGDIVLGSAGGKLVCTDWLNGAHQSYEMVRKRLGGEPFREGGSALTRRAAKELDEYFRGERKEFDLPLRFVATPFEEKVWRALQRIPYGKTVCYGDIAREIGQPGASQAVGGPSRSSFPATGWSGKTGRSPGTAAASPRRESSSGSRGRAKTSSRELEGEEKGQVPGGDAALSVFCDQQRRRNRPRR